VLKPSQTTVNVKQSSSGADDILVPHVIGASITPSESLHAGVAATDDINRAESPPSISGDVTGYRIIFNSCCLHVLSVCISVCFVGSDGGRQFDVLYFSW